MQEKLNDKMIEVLGGFSAAFLGDEGTGNIVDIRKYVSTHIGLFRYVFGT